MTLDSIITNLSFFYLHGLSTLLSSMYSAAKTFHLDTELSREQKNMLKEDLNFTSSAIMTLTQAQKSFTRLTNCLDQLNIYLDNKVEPQNYDYARALVYEILAMNILYLYVTNDDGDTTSKILTFMSEQKSVDKDTALLFSYLMKKSASMRDDMAKRRKDQEEKEAQITKKAKAKIKRGKKK